MTNMHFLAICFVIIICTTRLSISKSVSHIELNVRPLNEKLTNTISHSDSESFNKTAKPTKTNSVLAAMLNLFQNIENKFLSMPSNSQIYYTVLRILIFPKNDSKVHLNTTEQISVIVTSSEKVTTSSEECYDDDDDSTRPITLLDIKSDKFEKEKLDKISKYLPEVEHGSVQSAAF